MFDGMIQIRPLASTDAPAVFAAVDSSRPALARWMPWYDPTYSLADATAWVDRSVAEHDAGTGFHFAIVDDTGQFLGVVSLEDTVREPGKAMLGYWVASPSTGRGVASAAVGQALAWAVAHTDIRAVWALIDRDNLSSRRVAETNGLRLRAPDATSDANAQLVYERRLPEPAA